MMIVNFGQVVDLEHGSGFVNQFTVVMPNGLRVSIMTNEETIQQLMDLAGGIEPEEEVIRGGNGAAEETWAIPSTVPEPPPTEPGGEEFGGGYDPGEEDDDGGVIGAMVDQRVASQVAAGGLGSPGSSRPKPAKPRPMVDGDGFFMAPKGKTVPKDEMGYPIVSQRAAASPSGGDDDDDGQQI